MHPKNEQNRATHNMDKAFKMLNERRNTEEYRPYNSIYNKYNNGHGYIPQGLFRVSEEQLPPQVRICCDEEEHTEGPWGWMGAADRVLFPNLDGGYILYIMFIEL